MPPLAEVVKWREAMDRKAANKARVIETMGALRLKEKQAAGEPLNAVETDALARIKDEPEALSAAIASAGATPVEAREADSNDVGGDEGKAFAEAEQLAKALVAAKPELFAFIKDASLDEAVQTVDAFRAVGNLDMADLASMYIMAAWPPRHIGGDGAMVAKRI